jgi:hypothetical protein
MITAESFAEANNPVIEGKQRRRMGKEPDMDFFNLEVAVKIFGNTEQLLITAVVS